MILLRSTVHALTTLETVGWEMKNMCPITFSGNFLRKRMTVMNNSSIRLMDRPWQDLFFGCSLFGAGVMPLSAVLVVEDSAVGVLVFG